MAILQHSNRNNLLSLQTKNHFFFKFTLQQLTILGFCFSGISSILGPSSFNIWHFLLRIFCICHTTDVYLILMISFQKSSILGKSKSKELKASHVLLSLSPVLKIPAADRCHGTPLASPPHYILCTYNLSAGVYIVNKQ